MSDATSQKQKAELQRVKNRLDHIQGDFGVTDKMLLEEAAIRSLRLVLSLDRDSV